ncbi:MAG: F0F1 ATP synthase subunit alpha, partial [Microthrixaceae bacterium]
MAEIAVAELSKELQAAIAGLEKTEGLESAGVVIRVGDGVAAVHGLTNAGYSEVLEIDTSEGVVEAFALNLLEDEIGAVILGNDQQVSAGDTVRLKGT